MKFLAKELFNFIGTEILTRNQLVNLFTKLTYEVEGIISGNIIKGVKIGKIIHNEKHPNSNSLSYVRVETGREVWDVVCGGKNINVGQNVAHAVPGSKVGDNVLEPKEIRGIISNGMILSINEIGGFDGSLVEDINYDNILIFSKNTSSEANVAKLLDMDTDIYDVTILTDRTYANNYLKMAKEMAAFLKVDFLEPNPKIKISLEGLAEINQEYRTSFGALIELKESLTPLQIKTVLYHSGIKPTETIKDIFEYVKLLTGSKIELINNSIVASSDVKIKGSTDDCASLALRIAISLGIKYGYINKVGQVFGNEYKIKNKIKLTSKDINKLMGQEIPYDEIKPVLKQLDFEFNNDVVTIPSYREDITNSQEMIEEVARVYGIENIKKSPIKISSEIIEQHPYKEMQRNIVQELSKFGMQEIKTYQLISREDAIKYNINNITNFISLSNEYSVEYNTVQTSLLLGLLNTHIYNHRKDYEDIRLFELSNIFFNKNPVFTLGLIHDTKVNEKEPILATKKYISKILSIIGADHSKLLYEKTKQDLFNPYNVATIIYDEERIGIIGELHPKILREFKYIRIDKVKEKLYYAELQIEKLI